MRHNVCITVKRGFVMLDYEAIFNTDFVMKAMDLETMELVDKVVKVTNILDGPGMDKRDYCTVEGLQDWEIDMPFEDFLKNAKVAA